MNSCLDSVILTYAILLLAVPDINAQGREEFPFNDEWNFQCQSVSGMPIDQTLSLPHSWNTLDAQKGIQYYRGTGKTLQRDEPYHKGNGFYDHC